MTSLSFRDFAWILIATAVLTAPPMVWVVVNFRGPMLFTPGFDEWTGPLRYLGSVLAVFAVVLLAAVAIRRRSVREAAGIAIYVGSGAFLAIVVAFGGLLLADPSPTRFLEPTTAIDRNRFHQIYQEVLGSTMPMTHEFLMRRTWQVDEYGFAPKERDLPNWLPWQLWDEFGLPMRCFGVPYGLGADDWPVRPTPRQILAALLPEFLPRLRIFVVPFTVNTLFFAGLLYAVPRVPGWILARHRRQEDRCVKCGYILKNQPRCPECGSSA